jgi:predicted ABC-type transport system involved in lysophospholipase L1 biosynthesis ATPase subunit
VVKNYQGLRPLRLRHLSVARGQSVSLFGFDKTASQVLVNLITGSSLPDSGTVRVFGRETSEIADSNDWMDLLQRFGMFSDRTVLVEKLTVEQNLALTHTLEVESLSEDLRRQLREIADTLGIESHLLASRIEGLGALELALARLGRAVALKPDVLLAEHPTATLDAAGRTVLAKAAVSAVARYGMAAIYVTADYAFARAVGSDALTVRPATGELSPLSSWRRWLS